MTPLRFVTFITVKARLFGMAWGALLLQSWGGPVWGFVLTLALAVALMAYDIHSARRMAVEVVLE